MISTASALDTALAAINASDSDAISKAKASGLMRGYHERWKDVAWECLSVEESYQLPIINPETGRAAKVLSQAGKYDGLIRYRESGKTYLLEHKTASEDISDPSSNYWRRLRIDSQVSHYVLSQWQSGTKLDGTVYDVIRKPTIRPAKVDTKQYRDLVQNGRYFGFEVPSHADRLLKQENEFLYSLRLSRLCIDEPDKYFQRRAIPRLDSELEEYASELWSVQQSIQETRRTGRHFRNSGACVTYNSPCEYLSLCCGEDSIESDNWEIVDNVHSELPIIGNPKDVLTNTRIRTYCTCRRKHQLRYELGVRRRDEEERSALAFGSLFHEALANWWSFYKAPSHDDNRNPAIEVGGTVQELARAGQD